ncbi:hypothetical protein [Mesorhizobium sp. IMUNJ 23232]|uniref:hypothetical protein n=1 Tax=Mesorhizobium sp. IMUNJ 23232 TaxID=3376064 RepID=UPI0037AE827E
MKTPINEVVTGGKIISIVPMIAARIMAELDAPPRYWPGEVVSFKNPGNPQAAKLAGSGNGGF